MPQAPLPTPAQPQAAAPTQQQRRAKPSALFALSLLCASLLVACGGGGSASDAPPSPTPATPQLSMTLDPSFGEQGRVMLEGGNWGGTLLNMAELGDGKLLLLLSRNGPPQAMPSDLPPPENHQVQRSISLKQANQLIAMRLLPNGQLDASYGTSQGLTTLGVLGSEWPTDIMFTHNGGLYFELSSIEPCVAIADTVFEGSGATRDERCEIAPNTPNARLAKQTATWVQLTPSGQVADPNSLDREALPLTDAQQRIQAAFSTPRPFSWVHRASTHHWRFSSTANEPGWSPVYRWGASPVAIPGEGVANFSHLNSACNMGHAAPAEDETGQIWTVSHSASRGNQALCLERFSPSGQVLLASPIHLPLNAEAVALAQAQQKTIRIVAWQRPDTPAGEPSQPADLVWAHVDEAGQALPHGTGGITRLPLPAATVFSGSTLSPASHFLPDGSAWLYITQHPFQDISVSPKTFALHLNAQGEISRKWSPHGWVELSGAAANSELRLVDRQQRWLMLNVNAGQTPWSLIRLHGNQSTE